jgi:galactonate dehydratase
MATKIEQVESIRIGGTYLVRIRTESGLTGLGQTACWGYPDAVQQIVERFESYLVGQDPFRIEHHWQANYRTGPFRGSALSGAVSAVDIALWDIKGKHFGAPVWELMGGKCRERIRLFLLMEGAETPDQVATEARAAAEEGFTALKFDPLPDGYQNMSHARQISSVCDLVAAAREAVGDDVDLIVEIHRKLTPLVAVPLADALVEFRPLFYEDPIQIDSIVSQAEVARRISIPVANGERLHSIWEFRELLACGGPQYVRPDVGLAGGLTHCKKIAAIAESFHCAVVTHNFLSPVLTAASVHLDASIPNFVTQEYSKGDESPENAVYRTALKREGGYIPVPEAPGLGVELDEELLAEAQSETIDLSEGPLLRDDGSVAHSV